MQTKNKSFTYGLDLVTGLYNIYTCIIHKSTTHAYATFIHSTH